MRENLPQFWTTPFSEASTHAQQTETLGVVSKPAQVTKHTLTQPASSLAPVTFAPFDKSSKPENEIFTRN
jgi:hypothetical protein